ncbi:hypothetical protein [Oceanibacterium hippocampi]|uniref:Uncharacterized protein n=1 Tax=Oceanibacterium hippocampi TaxID=745714 RepID=A0A1Y5TV44_9PROT|nr:hypothetical protein [Oceanibacterium hippocampi]SLN73827.1 hypothetical protein OCH7691_03670 [Oceanibacterium hippocampi]
MKDDDDRTRHNATAPASGAAGTPGRSRAAAKRAALVAAAGRDEDEKVRAKRRAERIRRNDVARRPGGAGAVPDGSGRPHETTDPAFTETRKGKSDG